MQKLREQRAVAAIATIQNLTERSEKMKTIEYLSILCLYRIAYKDKHAIIVMNKRKSLLL